MKITNTQKLSLFMSGLYILSFVGLGFAIESFNKVELLKLSVSEIKQNTVEKENPITKEEKNKEETKETNNKEDDKKVKNKEEIVDEISVYLKENNYGGEILRSNKNFNLSTEIRKIKNFSGFTTNTSYTRLLNAIELRNNDKLEVKVPTDIIDNWFEAIKWNNTLSLSFLNQTVDFKKIAPNRWISKSDVYYVSLLDIPKPLRQNANACFSNEFYNSLTSEEKKSVSNVVEGVSALGDNFFNKNSKGEVEKTLDFLNDSGWDRMKEMGATSFFACVQKTVEGGIAVSKIDSNTLEFSYKSFSDYSYLGDEHIYPTVENYSYLSEKINNSTNFISGLIFTNLNTVEKYEEDDFKVFSDRVQASAAGVFATRSRSGENFANSDSNWKPFVLGKLDANGKTFKSQSKSFAGLYGVRQDEIVTPFWEWFNSRV